MLFEANFFSPSNKFTRPEFILSHKKRENRSGDIILLICHMTSRNRAIKDSYGSMDEGPVTLS